MKYFLIVYIFQCAVSLAVLYLPFHIWLRKETCFRTSRMTLLGITVLSFLLPLIDMRWITAWFGHEEWSVWSEMPETSIFYANPGHNMEYCIEPEDGNYKYFYLLRIVGVIYLLGVMFCFLNKLINLIRLLRFIPKGCLWIHREDGCLIYCHAHPIPPFSWMNRIVISEEDYQSNGQEILKHEQAHVACKHSWDVLWLSLVEILQWFNPLVWMLSKDMNAIHEFEADQMVLCKGIDKVRYQLLMIRKAISCPHYIFSNHFNQGQVKQRIHMMNTSTSPMRWKYLYLLPLIIACITVYGQKRPAFIQGHVTDEYGNALPDVMVDIPHVHTATLTHIEGRYFIDAGKEDTIRFRMRGYNTQNIPLKDYPIYNGTITLNVQLSKK